MNSSVASSSTARVNWLGRIGWAILALSAGYYIVEAIPAYLMFDEEAVGPYFWPRINTVFVHAMSGTVALVLGFFQFWPWLRNTHKKVHRIMGRTYLTAILVGSISGYMLAFTSSVHVVYAAGLAGLATAWLVTGTMALMSIRKRNINQHKQWMIRSYVVTFAFITFRLSSDILINNGIVEFPVNLMLMSWISWTIPLLLTEVVLQWREATK